VLELGFGLLALAPPAAAVRFEVELCRDDACDRLFSETAAAETQGFVDRAVPLDRWAGERGRLRFRASSVEPGAFPGLPVWSDPVLWARGPGEAAVAAAPARNVLLISLDTLAAKHVGAYGYTRDTSPFLDRWFGEGGTIFERCYTAATTTGPSHMTLLTGLPPSAHGVHGRTYYRALPGVVPTLALVFARAGYATGAVTENGPMGAYRGFSRGFGSYAENKSASVSAIHGHVETTFDAGRAWLERNRDKRFFLFLHTFQVHAPFDPPDAYQQLFDGDGVGAALESRVPKQWRAVRYDREIRYTDDVLRRFLEGLERDGLLDSTIVVVLSDHGEEFGEHGLLGHGAGIHEEVLHVPLMLRGPGIPAGRRVDARVSHLDFLPTILELAGVPGEPPGAGRSYASVLSGAEPADTAFEERPIFSEAWAEHAFRISGGRFERIAVDIPILVVRRGHRKLVRYPVRAAGSGDTRSGTAREVWFDLQADPGETRPRPADGPETQDLRALLDAYEQETRSTRDLLRGEGEGPGAPLDAQRREKLRALGYLE
jgi:arylsulfatase A-like enzyme